MKVKLPLFLIVLFILWSCAEKADQGRPNVILFFTDEMDPSYVSAYGGEIPTPSIDELASEGMRFENGYVVAPMCTPSRYALLTGKYPGRCDHPQFLEAYPEDGPYVIAWNTYLTETIATIPKILKEHGYFTGMTGKWHVGRLPDDIVLPSLDLNADINDPETDRKLKELQKIHVEQVKKDGGFDFAKSVLWGNFDGFLVESLRYHNFPWITKGALDFLDAAKEKNQPFFLYSATTAVHGPGHLNGYKEDISYTLEGKMEGLDQYNLDPDSMIRAISSVQAGMQHKYAGMASVDHHVKLVLQKLRELGMADNTLVIFMADHNVEPGKTTCYEKGLKVPLIINWPGKIKPNSVSKVRVQSTDLFPTILGIAGIEYSNLALDGKSIEKVLSGDEEQVHDYTYSESGLIRTVSDGKFKYIAFRYPTSTLNALEKGEITIAPNYMNMERQAHSSIAMEHYPSYFDADQLFDLDNDPYEQNNLAYDPAFATVKEQMQKVLVNRYLSGFNHTYPVADTSFMRSETYQEMVKKARAIGTDYIPWLRRDHGSIIWPPE